MHDVTELAALQRPLPDAGICDGEISWHCPTSLSDLFRAAPRRSLAAPSESGLFGFRFPNEPVPFLIRQHSLARRMEDLAGQWSVGHVEILKLNRVTAHH
jgi:hypothetical protein